MLNNDDMPFVTDLIGKKAYKRMKVIFSALSVLGHNMSNFKAVLRSKVHINLSVEIAKTHK